MDMKKILQAIDGLSTKPVEGSNVLTEGANPHKVTLPVQMAMQHYSKPVVKKNSLIRQYFQQVEEATLEKQTHRKQLIQQYAQNISQRVLENRRYSSFYNPDRDAEREWNAYQQGEQDFRNRERNAGLEDEDRYERQQRAKPKVVAWVFYDVKPGQEDMASIYKIRRLKNGKWAMPEYDISGRTYAFQRNEADKVFGKGKRWEPKKD